MSNLVKVTKFSPQKKEIVTTTTTIRTTTNYDDNNLSINNNINNLSINENYSLIPSESQSLILLKNKINFNLDSNSSKTEIPDTIQITYKNDIDITLIHDVIRKRFSHEKYMLPQYQQQVIDLKKLLSIATSINNNKKLTKEINDLNSKINDIQQDESWDNYVSKSKDLLFEYLEVTTDKTKGIVILGKRGETDDDKLKTEARLRIIDSYIAIASNYIILDILRIEKRVGKCPSCGTSFKKFNVDEDEGICICPNCKWFREILAKTTFNRDPGKAYSGMKNDYEDRENFYKAAIRFACKENKKFHINLEYDLDSYLVSHGHETCKVIREQPLVKGKKEGVGFKIMMQALTALSRTKNKDLQYRKVYSDYYENVWLLMHTLWGFETNDIIDLIPRLLEIYDLTQEIYVNMTPEERGGRDASLNTQFRLLEELLTCDFKCIKSDFKLPSSAKSLEIHVRSWKIMTTRAGIKHVQI